MTMTKKAFREAVENGDWFAFFPNSLDHSRAIIIVSEKDEKSPYTIEHAVFDVPFSVYAEDKTAAVLDALETAPDPVKVKPIFGMGVLKECKPKSKPMTPSAFIETREETCDFSRGLFTTKVKHGVVSIASIVWVTERVTEKGFAVQDGEGQMWAGIASFVPSDPIGSAVKEFEYDGDDLVLIPVEWKKTIVNYVPVK